MSRSFLFMLGKDLFRIPKDTPIEVGLPILSLILGGHICYAIGTKEEKEIFVTKKYTFVQPGFHKLTSNCLQL